jgi:hypothetical protein
MLLATLVASCQKGAPMPVVGPSPSPNVPAEAVLKVVPADTPFAVELSTELSTTTTQGGDPFRARVVNAIESNDGDTVVPADAELAGVVVGIRSAPEPAILVRFDGIETRWGPRTVRATFTRAQPVASIVGNSASFAGYDGALQPAPGVPLLTDDMPATSQQIDLPPGARLRMILTDPLAVRALVPNPIAVPATP